MAITQAGREWVAPQLTANFHIGLAIAGSELTGHGYSRSLVTNAQRAVATNVITVAMHDIYTADDAAAQDATQWAMFDAATGGNRLTDWENLTNNPDAPADGGTFLFTTATITV